MRRLALAAALAATMPMALAPIAPAMAQSPAAQARWDQAQRDYRIATDRFNAERDRYAQASRYGRGDGYRRGYDAPPPPPPPPGYSGQGYGPQGYYADDRDEGNYDPSRYYRDGNSYQERTLAADDRVYRGSDGKYYCKRSDGTTGLIIGAAGGGVLGNVIDGGHSRAAGTLIGAALGAIAGRAVDQNSAQVRCR
ncbi:glycine zipper 2TM domain-containing protein [Sphingomonas bacterium]|uniref:glycine zipper 2TM domain-containing protein n=1 Tax=Sphingomonas bacterium TaxID=1895847 RepID=UPI00157723F3|nr:glycine zipper 2TM domain-containing protein [Sphingomonas bacterium]